MARQRIRPTTSVLSLRLAYYFSRLVLIRAEGEQAVYFVGILQVNQSRSDKPQSLHLAIGESKHSYKTCTLTACKPTSEARHLYEVKLAVVERSPRKFNIELQFLVQA